MSGISSTLSIAQTAIKAQQYGLNVTGQNISNVNNPDYSVQNAEQKNMTPALYAGFLFGTGVDTEQIRQSVDKLLESRLTDEKSAKASFKEQESYIKVLEGFFDENSESSFNNIMSDFWNSWQDLADNPLSSAERVAVYQNGRKLASKFESAVLELDSLTQDINSEISSAVTKVNSITSKIADLNREIAGLEINRTANDLRDQRNSLINELGELIEVDTFEQPNGALTVNVANGFTIVSGVDTYDLAMKEKQVIWEGSYGADVDISDKLSGGQIGGWLEMRDEIIPKYRSDIEELADEMIWAINYQHAQGAGMNYFTRAVTGDYRADHKGLLSSLAFGDKIDYSKDFTIWARDRTTADTEYWKSTVDMGISEARLTDWEGTAPGGDQLSYKFTVVDGTVVGDKKVAETSAVNLAEVWGTTSGTAATALDNIMAEQTLTVYNGPSGTRKIAVKDAGGDAKRSAASIAEALNGIDGVSAYASENSGLFDISGISSAQDGDEVQFSLYVDGYIHEQRFTVDSNEGSLTEQFAAALKSSAGEINAMNEDDDLETDGLRLTSKSGRTIGIEIFEVRDNAGIRITDFSDFDADDTVTFTLRSDGIPTTRTEISVDLSGVDTTDQGEMVSTFYDAFNTALDDEPFTVEEQEYINSAGVSTSSIVLRTTDGSNITLEDPRGDTGDDATFDIAALSGTTTAGAGNTVFEFSSGAAPTDIETFSSLTTSGDSVTFSMPQTFTTAAAGTTETIAESSSTAAGSTTSAVIAGTVTALVDDGMYILSDDTSAQGLYGTSGTAVTGSAIMTLGGEDGFSNFTATDVISFDVDGISVAYTAGAGTTEIALAMQLESELTAALVTPFSDPDYDIIRTGKSVSIVKAGDLEDPIEITSFSESGSNDAALKVRTGTGSGTSAPDNDWLESGDPYRDSATSSLYADKGIIQWEKFDQGGLSTGASGLLEVADEGGVVIRENGVDTLSFNISEGSLVAGNTLTVNTDQNGSPNPLDFTISGRANSLDDTYYFKVVSGGRVGHVPAEGQEPLVIEWHNSVDSGSFTIEGHDPPYTPEAPVEIDVDGMNLDFRDGTLFTDDVFTITTDATGTPASLNEEGRYTGETLADWHWTLGSFADQFNRQTEGLKASETADNRLKIGASDEYHAVENIQYSGQNGFCEENCSIDVKDWRALDFPGNDLTFVRSSGSWGVLSDPTGGTLEMIPEDGDDDGFGVDFSGDGLADLEVNFHKKVTGDGSLKMDFVKHDAADIGFAFSDDAAASSGLAAAAGINTFFKGEGALTMEMNEKLSNTNFLAAGRIDSATGHITQGDNTNALAITDIQHQSKDMKLWNFQRGEDAESSITDATFDEYYNAMIGSLGVTSRGIKNSKAYADRMVQSLTEQRNEISSVSLDEEMIKLIKYQHAFSAASKLLTVSDEMLNTLISIR